MSYLHYEQKHWFKAKLTWDLIVLPGNNLENTWIMYHQRSGDPEYGYTGIWVLPISETEHEMTEC